MTKLELFLSLLGSVAIVSVLCTTSFVSMIVAKAVKTRPDITDISQDQLETIEKVSKITFYSSTFIAGILLAVGLSMAVFWGGLFLLIWALKAFS